MGGLKFLITLFVIYLIFRSIMRKVLSAVNSDGGGALKGKLGGVIEQMKQEMEKAKLEAEREAAEMDEETDKDLWAEVREAGESSFEERPFFSEEILETEEMPSAPSRALWDEADETPSYWDSPDEEAAPVAAAEVPEPSSKPCRARRKARGRLQEAVLWKEILDRPVGLRA